MKKIISLGILFLVFFLGGSQIVLAADSNVGNTTKINYCGTDAPTKGYVCTSNTSGKTCVENYCLAEASNVKCCKSASGSSSSASDTSIPNPLGTTNINLVVSRIISYVLGLIGTVSLLLFIYGGLIWMTSAGSSDKVKKGRDILVWAVIGMAVVFTSYILVKFIIQGAQGVLK
jgi:hypothetical protein